MERGTRPMEFSSAPRHADIRLRIDFSIGSEPRSILAQSPKARGIRRRVVSKWEFTKGLHDLGRGAYAYLQPSGTWGYSNAGLIIDGDQSLLVDTLFDEMLTAEMLGVMQDATGFGADRIGVVVNTHSNGDHTFGNRLAKNAVIIASEATAHEMREEGDPKRLAALMKNTD